jgi:hypothetical protein
MKHLWQFTKNRMPKRVSLIATGVLGVLLLAGPAGAFTITLTVDENGNGTINGFLGPQPLPSYFAADPGPGGLGSVLTYDMLNPPGLVSGDVQLIDPNGAVLDVIRFNANEVNPSGSTGSLLFYSDNVDGFDSKGDTSSPPGSNYTNLVSINEVGSESVNGAIYTPTAGQPGFVAGTEAQVTYIFRSDVPEPGSLIVLGLGFVTLGGISWAKRRKAEKAAAA